MPSLRRGNDPQSPSRTSLHLLCHYKRQLYTGSYHVLFLVSSVTLQKLLKTTPPQIILRFTIFSLTLYRTNFPKYEAQPGNIDDFPQRRLPAFSVLPPYNERFKHHATLYIPPASFHKKNLNPSHHDKTSTSS